MIRTKLNLIKQVKSLRVALASIIILTGVAGISLPAIASAAPRSTTASCSISGVPKKVASGTYITPTITVSNAGANAFTTTVNGVQSEISKNGSKGGGFEQTVTVAPGSSVAFQGGTTETQSGYKFKVVAKSSNPKFSCHAVTAKID